MTIHPAIPALIILPLLVAALCACCYFLGRLDQTLSNWQRTKPKKGEQ